MILKAQSFRWEFPRQTLLMGIINVTPDSFSDGGLCKDTDSAVQHGLHLIQEGADILDIGGESTRPGAESVGVDEELRRVIPVIQGLKDASNVNIPISIDTQKPEVAEQALDAGANIVNDIAANRQDPAMWRLAANARAGYVCMHMQGTPQNMQVNPRYENVVTEVYDFFKNRFERICAAGVHPECIVFDPGIGFGKTLHHNLQLLAGLREFTSLNRPLLVGLSRKSFLSRLAGSDQAERLSGSIAGACWSVHHGASILRVHDVGPSRRAVQLFDSLNGKS